VVEANVSGRPDQPLVPPPPDPGAPPSMNVQIVLEVEHSIRCPFGITVAGPAIVFVVVAALVQFV
jgi:hypothetical protein